MRHSGVLCALASGCQTDRSRRQIENNECFVRKSDGSLFFSFPVHQNVHVVAFGKASIGMAQGAFASLEEHIVRAIVSAPSGQQHSWAFLLGAACFQP
jgi:hypothetical protein